MGETYSGISFGKKLPLFSRAYLLKNFPTGVEAGITSISAILLVLSFPDFDAFLLAWIAIAPVLVIAARRPQPLRAFLLGWLFGTLFFYGSCYWLTYSLVHYGGIPAWIAYPLIFLPAMLVGLLPALCFAALARLVSVWGQRAVLIAPLLWAASEFGRLGLTGQLWNAVGYSQAYHPSMVQAARWGGVYAVGFLIIAVNSALAYIAIRFTVRSFMVCIALLASVGFTLWFSNCSQPGKAAGRLSRDTSTPDAFVIAVQPDVPMEPGKTARQLDELLSRHVTLSETGLRQLSVSTAPTEAQSPSVLEPNDRDGKPNARVPRIVIWPESPMNFTYARDTEFREMLEQFTEKNDASVLFNSLEPAAVNGSYNAAVMVNEQGRIIAQYDKIRLLPFGEYVPLPRWLPGFNLVPVMVGDFTSGVEYPLIPFGKARAGVFICFESAFPSIARTFSNAGADVLVNISNDGYLGPTAVMRQHLANAILRAVENQRPVLRVTNTGITAYITPEGRVKDATAPFQPALRSWKVNRAAGEKTFYTLHGDLFAGLCALLSLMLVAGSFAIRKVTPPDR